MKVFYQSIIDFFIDRKFLIFSIIAAFILPRIFYGRFVYYYGDSAYYYFSLENFTEYIDSFIKTGRYFNLNNKKTIFILSMFTSFAITIGIFRKGYLFSKSKVAATYTALLYLIHPLSVWYSGEPRLEHFTHSLFIGGIFLSLNQNSKLLWKNLLGIILFFIAAKTDPNLYGYIILFYLFNILESFVGESKLPSNFYILVGQAILFLFSALVLMGWGNITPLSEKLLEQVSYLIGLSTGGSQKFFTQIPEIFDEYFRNIMKSFFSPVLIIFPIIVLGFGRELHLSNYSRGLYSISLLICSKYFLELKNLSTGNYSQMYAAIVLSILVSSIGCHRLYNRFKSLYLRLFIVVFLPLSLTIGLAARGYRDYYRQQSIVGLIPGLQKNITQKGQTLFLPFGQDLNAKQFKQFKTVQGLEIVKIPHLRESEFSKILLARKEAYLFLDDYFVFNFFWPGKFLLNIQDSQVVDDMVIKKLFETKSIRNKGHLFKLEWKR